jgi:ribokinase
VTAGIVVVGSINRDLSVVVPRHPAPGETVLGTKHYWDNGGKGANQAVAAMRLGGRVAMIGLVGEDREGELLRSSLARMGIDTRGVEVCAGAPTGLAVITVDADAENTIVVSAGANSELSPDHIARHADTIAGAAVLLTQLEVPLDAVDAAMEVATGIVCLNPAPAAALSPETLSRVDVLVPNRTELARLADTPEVSSHADAASAVARLETEAAVVVTLGREGAMIVDDGEIDLVPTPRVESVDPTGAGDAFCGALAQSLSQGESLSSAVRRAVAAGASATMRPGAQAAMPTNDELERLLSA